MVAVTVLPKNAVTLSESKEVGGFGQLLTLWTKSRKKPELGVTGEPFTKRWAE